MEDIISFLLVFALGWWLGSKVTAALQFWTFAEVLRELGITNQQLRDMAAKHGFTLPPDESDESTDDPLGDLPVVEIRVEQHANTLYVFRKDTDEFLGQGSSKEDLIARLGEKLRGVRLSIAEEDGADFIGGKYTFSPDSKSITKTD